MSSNDNFSFRGYSLLSPSPRSGAPSESTLQTGGSHAGYYVAVFLLLTLLYIFSSSRGACGSANVPYYKAGKLKWMFDAETLVRDSYAKVRPNPHPTTYL